MSRYTPIGWSRRIHTGMTAGEDRCLHYKSALFDALTRLCNLSGASMALGTNVEDLRITIPGQSAARMAGRCPRCSMPGSPRRTCGRSAAALAW